MHSGWLLGCLQITFLVHSHDTKRVRHILNCNCFLCGQSYCTKLCKVSWCCNCSLVLAHPTNWSTSNHNEYSWNRSSSLCVMCMMQDAMGFPLGSGKAGLFSHLHIHTAILKISSELFQGFLIHWILSTYSNWFVWKLIQVSPNSEQSSYMTFMRTARDMT